MTSSARISRWLLLLAILAIPSLVHAQAGQYTLIQTSAEPLPACANATTPQQGQPLVWDTTAQSLETCTGFDTWTPVGSGGSGGGVFASYKFGTNAAITTSGNYFQLGYDANFSPTYAGTGASGTPYIATLKLSSNISVNAATASALASLPTPCATGSAPTGILANGNSTGCVLLPLNEPAVTHNFLTAYNSTTGAFTQAQPAYSDISGTPTLYYQTVQANGTPGTQEPTINLVAGTNMTVALTTVGLVTTVTLSSSATAATAYSAITPATNSTSGNFIATGNVWDYSGATVILPVAPGLAPTANGRPGYDSTANKWVFGQNGAAVSFGLSSSPCTSGQYVNTPATGTTTAACAQVAYSQLSGAPTLFYQTVQSNTAAQTQEPALNFSTNFTLTTTASTRTNVDLASTISVNTSGNAGTATMLAGTPTLCTTGQAPTGILPSGNATGCASIGGAGSVTTTGSPATGNLTKFSGATSITNGDLSGDVTTAGTLVTTVGKVNGVSYGTLPATNSVPVVTGTNTVSYEAVPNAALANAGVTISTTAPLGGGGAVALGGTLTLTCTTCITTATGANTALSNLAAVAVNLALTPGTDATISLDSVTKRYVNGWFSSILGWTNGSGTSDTGLSRDAAGVVDFGNGAAGDTSGAGKAAEFETSGSNGGITLTEGSGASLTPSTSVDISWGDSTGQRPAFNPHNTGKVYEVGVAAAGTAGHCKIYASNGYDDADAGGGCGGISGLTTGWIPQAGSATTIVNSNPQLDNGVTTANRLTYKGTAGMSIGTGTTTVYTTVGSNQNVEIGSGNGSGSDGGTGTTTVFNPILSGSIATATNCASGASPAVCGSASSGSVAVPTGINPTLVINTSAVTANSVILLTIDESLGTKLSVTCNTTVATLIQPVITARSAGTSFTIEIGATLATNPACVNYVVLN